MTARRLVGVALLAALVIVLVLGPWRRPAPDPPPDVTTYVVVRGDTLFLVARAHGVTVEELRAWNGIDGDLIEVGQELRILGATRAPVAAAAPPRARRRDRPSDSPPTLSLPPEKTCLAGPSIDQIGGDHGAVASRGLTHAEVRGALDAFVGHTLRCVPEGETPEGTVHTRLTVACTGRVAEVVVLNRGPLSPEAAGCVRDTLRFVPFPAHDLPDGFSFEYPLTFSFR